MRTKEVELRIELLELKFNHKIEPLNEKLKDSIKLFEGQNQINKDLLKRIEDLEKQIELLL